MFSILIPELYANHELQGFIFLKFSWAKLSTLQIATEMTTEWVDALKGQPYVVMRYVQDRYHSQICGFHFSGESLLYWTTWSVTPITIMLQCTLECDRCQGPSPMFILSSSEILEVVMYGRLKTAKQRLVSSVFFSASSSPTIAWVGNTLAEKFPLCELHMRSKMRLDLQLVVLFPITSTQYIIMG